MRILDFSHVPQDVIRIPSEIVVPIEIAIDEINVNTLRQEELLESRQGLGDQHVTFGIEL